MIGNLGLLIAFLALLSSALFSTLHLALRSVVRTRLADMADETNRPAAQKRVASILEDVEGHCLAIGLPRIISTLLVPVALVFWIAGPAAVAEGAPPPAPTTSHVAIALVVSAIFLWLFGFVVPSSLATHVGEGLILRLSLLIRAIYVILRPIDRIARFVDEIVRRLARVDEETDAEVLEAELLSVVEEGRQEGQFDEAEQDMIEAVVEFRSTTVEEIMTPRTEIEALQHTDDLSAVKAFVGDCPHSRIPVYDDNLDHITGVLYAKDFLRYLTTSPVPATFTLQQLLRPALFVPETKTVRQLMHELLAQKVHIAMVIDEYGGTAGLVTIEDIVEEIFGEIQDEYEDADEATPEITIDAEAREAIIDARMHIDDANDALEPLDLEIPESEDYDTVAGFVTVTLGRIPEAGESFVSASLSVLVLEAEPTRVVRIRIGLAPEPPPEQDEPADRAMAK